MPGRSWVVKISMGCAVAGVAALLPAAGASAGEPTFIGWSSVLAGAPSTFQPTSSDDCAAGRESCVRRVITALERHLDPLADSCRHEAVFALSYLRTTETYLETARTPGFYEDPRFVNHEDAAFAQLYFDAVEAWDSGQVDIVPPAWRIAFEAARQRRASGSGDLLLGINAHVNRDLPFALAAVGLTAPDGRSRKHDHDRINAMLNKVVDPLIAEEARRFDPTMSRSTTPYGIGYTALMQLLTAWREGAWRAAERLVAAPTRDARAVVAAEIEATAAANARWILEGNAYREPLSTTRERDAYCAQRAA